MDDATAIDRAAATQGATSSALEDKPAEDQVDAATAAAIDAVEGLMRRPRETGSSL